MANVYSDTRPLFGDGPQTPLHKELEAYAHRHDVQQLMHDMLTELITAQPDDPVAFMITWLQTHRKQTHSDADKTSPSYENVS